MTKNELLERAKPILFNTEMVRAIQDGRKTVTRRVIKSVPETAHMFLGINSATQKAEFLCGEIRNEVCLDWEVDVKLPFRIGDILYVRETWYYESAWHDLTAGKPDLPSGRYSFRYVYKADSPDYPVDVGVGADGWKPSIHMPKEAARIFLRVKKISVERLQNSFFKSGSTIFALLEEGVDIGEQCRDCIDDESECGTLDEVRSDYSDLWNSTVKKSDLEKYGWSANPWVWVIEFERVEVS